MTRRIEFTVGDNVHTYRYPNDNATYALVICHGGGGWGGMYDKFCYPMNEKTGADIWSFDCPGFGQSGRERGVYSIEEYEAALDAVIAEVRTEHDKPIFVLGSSAGGMLASIAFYKEDVTGVCIQASPLAVTTPWWAGMRQLFNNPAVDALLASPFGEHIYLSLVRFMDLTANYGDEELAKYMENHVLHTDMIKVSSFASFFNYQAPYPLTENEKPFFYIYAARDQMFTQDAAEATWNNIGGPKERHIIDSDKHQVMLCHTEEFIEAVDKWVNKYL